MSVVLLRLCSKHHVVQASVSKALRSDEGEVGAAATILIHSITCTLHPAAAAVRARIASSESVSAPQGLESGTAADPRWQAAAAALADFAAQHVPDIATLHACAASAWLQLTQNGVAHEPEGPGAKRPRALADPAKALFMSQSGSAGNQMNVEATPMHGSVLTHAGAAMPDAGMCADDLSEDRNSDLEATLILLLEVCFFGAAAHTFVQGQCAHACRPNL